MPDENDVFPRQADLEGIIDNGSYKEVRDLLRDEGVFISCRKERLGEILTRYIFKQSFYEAAFGQIERRTHGVGLTGLRFIRDNLDGIHEKIRELRNKPLKGNRYFARFVSVSKEDNDVLEVGIEYEKINPRLALYRRKDTYTILATIRIIDKGEVEISANAASNTDSVVLRDLGMDLMKMVKAPSIDIDLTRLSIKSRVELFDQLIKDDAKKLWRIETCSAFTIRHSEKEDSELGSSDLKALKSAVLDGNNLREHDIVEKLIKEEYFFSSATFYTYKSSDPNQHIRLKVEFKKNPAVLLVTAESSRKFDANDKAEIDIVSQNDGQECVRHFWDEVHRRFKALEEDAISKAKKVQR